MALFEFVQILDANIAPAKEDINGRNIPVAIANVTSLAIDPKNSSTLYTGTSKGVYTISLESR